MEMFGTSSSYSYYGLWLLLALLFHVLLRAVSGGTKKPALRLPPGPWQLPVIGSVHHLLRGMPHHAMRDLSRRYGPLMRLKVCEHVVYVVSSREVVREIFKGAHDATAFEQRPTTPGLSEVYAGEGQGVIFAPYGDRWRLLRRILMTELLSIRRIEAFRSIREEEAARLVATVASSPPGLPLNVDEVLARFIADSSVRAIFGDTLPDRAGFLEMIKHGTDLGSLFDLRDLFPSSRLVAMLPRPRKKEYHRKEVSRLMDEILRHHEKRRGAGGSDDGAEQDMIDVLLRLQKDGGAGDMRVSLTDDAIKAVSMDVFGAALDTSTTTLQWAMAELVGNPKVLEKAQEEVRRVLAGKEKVEEAALSEMRYLNAAIKETLRLHGPAPLIPRVCLQDQKIHGYDVPRGTVIITNSWVISRDPKYWEDPDKFEPERFLGERALDYRGMDFEFTPFGAGRRICPGMHFSHANVEIALASLLYHFDWKLPAGVEQLDMTESFGVTIKRKAELILRPIPRA